MDRTRVAPALALALAMAAAATTTPRLAASATPQALADGLVAAWTAPEGAERERTHALNAEWDLMARLYLVLALANLSVEDETLRARYLPVIDRVIDDTLRAERAGGHYHFLMAYARAKPWKVTPPRSLFVDGEVALMLGARLLLAPHGAYAAALRRRVDLIVPRMRASPVRCAESYPDECWTFCNTVALAAIRIADAVTGSDHGPVLRDWVATARERLLDDASGLLLSSYTVAGDRLDGPEGSSVWMAAHMLQLVDPVFAREQYDAAKKALAGAVGPFAYAREWPVGQESAVDVDAGVVVPFLGASTGASGLALVGAAAFRDARYDAGLRRSLALLGVDDGQRSELTGGAVGQAVLLYAQTLGPLWEAVRRRARPGAAGAAAGGVDCAWFDRVSAGLRKGEPPPDAYDDPIRLWRAIEVCGAAGPTLCHQAAAGARAVPSMAVSDGGVDMDAWRGGPNPG